MEIKVLMRRSVGIREMARELGCSRNTIRRYLRETAAGQYGPRLERIDAARPHWIPAVVLLREIKERGYLGGITQLKEFLSTHRHVKLEPVVRFETAPVQKYKPRIFNPCNIGDQTAFVMELPFLEPFTGCLTAA